MEKGDYVEVVKDMSVEFRKGHLARVERVEERGDFTLSRPVVSGRSIEESFGFAYASCVKRGTPLTEGDHSSVVQGPIESVVGSAKEGPTQGREIVSEEEFSRLGLQEGTVKGGVKSPPTGPRPRSVPRGQKPLPERKEGSFNTLSDSERHKFLGYRADELNALGSGTSGFDERTKDYSPALLETFENKHRGAPYWIQLICGEFTSLCPKTGQPDWAEITISYVPDALCLESKALKLYLMSFRNHGDFHEDVCNVIANDLFNLVEPFYLEVYGRFNPRGGIAIYPFVTRCRDDDEEWSDFTEMRNLQFAPTPQKGPVLR